jgi:hypothetical protein
MKRVFTILGILAVGSVAPIGGEAADCIADQRCAEGQQPPACCQPPPCEMFEYLKVMRAKRRMMSGNRPEKALRDNKGNHAQAIKSLQKALSDEWSTLKTQSNCRVGVGPYTVPKFSISRESCEVSVQTASGWKPVENPLELLQEFDGCNEMLEAEFAEASLRKGLCEGAVPGNTGWWAHRESAGAKAQIDTMMGHLQRWWGACSAAAPLGEKTRDQMEEADVDMGSKAFQISLETLSKGSKAKPKPTVRGGRGSR